MSEGVDLSGVSVDFGNFRAVDNVSISIQPGEFFSFLGPSGCGKTTILRAISGFISPTNGVISIGGQSMQGIGPNRRPTALIFQNLALFPLMPVWENISFGLEVRGVEKSKRRARAEELLRLVDLPNAADKSIAQLSGGQKQRVAIARALAVEPKVMLLDEPLSALDLKLRQHMRAELRAIQKRTKITFIYITHDQGEALAMSDRVGVMSQGRLQQVDTPQVIYERPVNGFVASFVGENNVFDGTVEEVRDGRGVLRTRQGDVFSALVGPGVEKGMAARLYVRPERVALAEVKAKASGEMPNRTEVTVQSVTFEGNFININVTDRAQRLLIVQIANDGSRTVMSAGAKAYLEFSPTRATILTDDATAQPAASYPSPAGGDRLEAAQ